MFLLFLICPILFSYLYQLSFVEKLDLTYFKLRSHCDYCYRQLRIYEMIPIFSFLFQRGKTTCCNKQLNRCYFVGESLALLPVFFVLQYNTLLNIDYSTFLLIYLFLLVLALYDIATFSIPLHMLFIFTFCICVIVPIHFISFLLVSSLLHLIYFFCNKSIGYGDILVFSVLALALPFSLFRYLFLFTFIIGGVFALFHFIFFRNTKQCVPLIPFIFFAFNLTIIFQQSISYGVKFL
ncbi:signal peptidase [Staphylococcus saprophyticus]|uniref:Putative signal peptidase n=1 Tax=Staphylococcus saprophyticus subsp. saprophyticus (strain ATCC 15305 / DSM 20229 / NCIMB 8711 / NCTC 7292 / S-41) TaxID=342451 RepID=Q49Y93_STAS1|nr:MULTISPECIES: prepilin peptidase [Staphylococcus]CRV16507.1 prepilin peptidase type IV [Streptococcus equi subsp. equi]AMG20217.1 signal peptidase [Staphylococcus saprophyticus]AMG33277.1 signal peptidase [Staphylococcus saprophyticus]ASE59196.1 signal peptidase [Staphylococcus saprophyticus]AVM32944.1 signal peptidase [Staphylococcus saprophyticus]